MFSIKLEEGNFCRKGPLQITYSRVDFSKIEEHTNQDVDEYLQYLSNHIFHDRSYNKAPGRCKCPPLL